MPFSRRDPPTLWRRATDLVWPRMGWSRTLRYHWLRLRRLPDSPERIGRGIAAGVFVSFSPFFGGHMILSLVAARAVGGNYLAAVMGTFILNPVTVVPIMVASFESGYLLTSARADDATIASLPDRFGRATQDLWSNAVALLTGRPTNWTALDSFATEVFLPYFKGWLIAGPLAAIVCYWLVVPPLRAWQHHRSAAGTGGRDAVG